jgi:hypothetical protein
MKASQFTDAQKAFIIKQGEDGAPVAEICRKAGISQATYFNWKKIYGPPPVRKSIPAVGLLGLHQSIRPVCGALCSWP